MQLTIETQDFLLEASRYLQMGYFDMLEQLLVKKDPTENFHVDDEFLETLTPQFSELLNISEDEYYRLLYITGCTGTQCTNSRGNYGMQYPVVRFSFGDALDFARNHSMYQIRFLHKDENPVERSRDPLIEPKRGIEFLGVTNTWYVDHEEDKKTTVELSGSSCVDGLLLYLYKHTSPKQTYFHWGPCVRKMYERTGSCISITSPKNERRYIPVLNFISHTEYFSYAELNPACLEYLESEPGKLWWQ